MQKEYAIVANLQIGRTRIEKTLLITGSIFEADIRMFHLEQDSASSNMTSPLWKKIPTHQRRKIIVSKSIFTIKEINPLPLAA